MKKKHRKSVQRFVFVFAFTLALFLVSSFLISSVAGRLVLKDNLSQAQMLYKLSKTLNPLNESADKGALITQALIEERKGESEETVSENTLAENGQKYVLGASATVPILMYHYIRYNPNPKDKVGWNLSVTPPNFDAQMNYLQSHGYHAISLDELGANIFNNSPLPSKPVVITLDDGYMDAYTQAYPILKAHGMKAVEFVITGFVGGPGFLTWDAINQMKDVFTFEGHTVNHIALTYATDTRVIQEITASKNALRDNLGYPINWLAYPLGNVDTRVARLTQKAGYVGAFGTNLGSYLSRSAMFTLPRVRIGGGDTAASLAKRLPY